MCRSAVKFWADSYRTASNSNDYRCKDMDPNYKASQVMWATCSSGENLRMRMFTLYFS